MKKTYISPAMLTVQLGTMHIIAESLVISNDSITSSEEISVKETSVSDKSVWDEEW